MPGRWSEFSQLLIFPPKISIVSHNFRQLQLWTDGEGYAGWSSANRCRWVKSKIVKIFSRLTERATWPGGSRLQISGGGRAGKSGWYFHQTQSIFSGSRQMSPNKFFSTTRSSSDSRLFLIVGNQQIPSKSSLFLVRVGYCGVLHGTFASSSQTTTASTPTVKRKNQIWLFLAARYIFPIALEAQLWRGGDDGKHGRIQVI